ncbi:hypothetical protein JYU34_001353 [Plutella xylostella]|uniref:Uncharacterized protein n=1 Tax=Plutella xylostella TaxID=51655 RepID=A0ABQ7R3Q8_PLUXY|nr:hypothetical protein JYU34_001353 [Plutella xylostella]
MLRRQCETDAGLCAPGTATQPAAALLMNQNYHWENLKTSSKESRNSTLACLSADSFLIQSIPSRLQLKPIRKFQRIKTILLSNA